jgi:hypothetical protein
MELAHYIDHLQDENDELRQLMGWLSGHEPQLRMMIEAFKHQDGEALGANKVVEGSGENEGKIGDIPKPPKTHHKNVFVPKPNYLRNRLDTTPTSPVFLHKPTTSRNPSSSRVTWGMSSLGNRERNRVRKSLSSERNPKTKPKPKPYHCEHCGRDGHLAEFCFRRKQEWRLARELANKDRYRPSRGVPELRLVPRGEGMVRTIYPRERHEFVPRGEPPHRERGRHVALGHDEFARHSFARGQYEYGGTIVALGPRGATGHGLPSVVRVVLQGDVWLFCLGETGRSLLTPRLSKWCGTSLIRYVLTPVLSLLLTLALVFYFAGGRH